MPKKRRDIESGLLKKGFVKDNKDHRILRLMIDGKITSIRTFTSHGSRHEEYNDSLLNKIKKELRLDSKTQLNRLIECPLDYEEYVSYLRTNGVFL